jgi:hypothetical protein
MKHSAISRGVTEKELRRVCDGNVDVHCLNYKGGMNFDCDTIFCDVTGIMLEYLTPQRWKHLTRLNVIGTFERCGRYLQELYTGKQLSEALRFGVLTRLTHLVVKIRPALSCEDIIAWDTPNLEMLSFTTGTDWWKVLQPTRFAEIFTKTNALKHLGLEWAPANNPPNDHANLRYSHCPNDRFCK